MATAVKLRGVVHPTTKFTGQWRTIWDQVNIAECPEAGTVDQGATKEEAVAGLKEATKHYLEEFPRSYSLCVSLEYLSFDRRV